MKGEQAQALAHGKTPPTHEAPVPLQTIIINPKMHSLRWISQDLPMSSEGRLKRIVGCST